MHLKVIAAAASTIALFAAAPAGAATFVVNSTADVVDASPGDGICATATGACTLRAATMESGASVDYDAITVPAGRFELTLPPVAGDDRAGGDIDIDTGRTDVTGAGAGQTIIDANGLDRVLQVTGQASFLRGLSLTGGDTAGNGGGLLIDASIDTGASDIEVYGNRAAGDGGGIYLRGTTGGLQNAYVHDNQARDGGGVYVGLPTEITLERSAIVRNTATREGGGLWSQVYNAGTSTTIRNTTFSGNAAGVAGGAIVMRGGDTGAPFASVSFVTATNNAAPDAAGILIEGGAFLSGTLSAHNLGADCRLGPAVLGTATSMDTDGTCGAATTVADAGLGALAFNGGPTPTHALLPGSPAIDATACGPAVDQRGVARPQGAACDIGAFERKAGDPVDDDGEPCANVRNGTPRRDVMTGTAKGDDLRGLSGNDDLSGLGGDDCLSGGSGADKLLGGDGDDLLRGGTGADWLDGGNGDDELFGGTGADTLRGGAGDDAIEAGEGHDTIVGGAGADVIAAGQGHDTIAAADGERDEVFCGQGKDRVTADAIDVLRDCERVDRS